jgi:comEA protein
MWRLSLASIVCLVALGGDVSYGQGSKKATKRAPGTAGVGGKVNINTASEKELDKRLPGIGPVKAKAIIEFRKQSPFKTIDELDLVKGIGPKTMEKVRPLITVGDPNDDDDARPGPKDPVQDPPPPPPPKDANKSKSKQGSQERGRSRGTPDASTSAELAVEDRLRSFPLDRLEQLLSEKEVEYREWRRQHNMTASCAFQSGAATRKETEVAIISECHRWKRTIDQIKKVIKEKQKAG